MDHEIWLQLPAPLSRYEASNLGRIRRFHDQFILRHGQSADGYCRIPLTLDTRVKRTLYVHRLVASVFCAGDQSQTVNHKNLIKHDNRAENLEWVSFSENHKHKFRLRPELCQQRRDSVSLPVIATNIETQTETRFPSGKAAAIALGDANRAGNISHAIACGTAAYGRLWRKAT